MYVAAESEQFIEATVPRVRSVAEFDEHFDEESFAQMKRWLGSRGVALTFTIPGSPQQDFFEPEFTSVEALKRYLTDPAEYYARVFHVSRSHFLQWADRILRHPFSCDGTTKTGRKCGRRLMFVLPREFVQGKKYFCEKHYRSNGG